MASPEPPTAYATIREVHAVQDALLREMRAMEERLSAKIENANVHHEETHDHMRRTADQRHERIDDFIEGQALAAAMLKGRDSGRSGLIGQTYTVLRLLNEFRWLIAALIAGAVVLSGGASLTVN